MKVFYWTETLSTRTRPLVTQFALLLPHQNRNLVMYSFFPPFSLYPFSEDPLFFPSKSALSNHSFEDNLLFLTPNPGRGQTTLTDGEESKTRRWWRCWRLHAISYILTTGGNCNEVTNLSQEAEHHNTSKGECYDYDHYTHGRQHPPEEFCKDKLHHSHEPISGGG